MEGGGDKEIDGGINSTMIHCENFLSVTMYPSTTIIKNSLMVKKEPCFYMELTLSKACKAFWSQCL
jgi:hypothetical protein